MADTRAHGWDEGGTKVVIHAIHCTGSRLRLLLISCGLAVLASSCIPHFGSDSGPVRRGVLTSDGAAHFTYQGTTDGATISVFATAAPVDASNREAFWLADSPWYADQETCETWNTPQSLSQFSPFQPGIATRIAPTGANNEGIKAVTVTQNVWLGGLWKFNVHVWDSTNAAAPYTLIQTFDLAPILGRIEFGTDGSIQASTLAPPPWHICVQTQGNALRFKVWTGVDEEPGWTDPDHVFATTLPDGWDYPGYAGGYIGHLHDGQSMNFTDLTSTPLCLATDMTDTPYCRDLVSSATSTQAPTTTAVQDNSEPPATTAP
jgi:hypothetical protein